MDFFQKRFKLDDKKVFFLFKMLVGKDALIFHTVWDSLVQCVCRALDKNNSFAGARFCLKFIFVHLLASDTNLQPFPINKEARQRVT